MSVTGTAVILLAEVMMMRRERGNDEKREFYLAASLSPQYCITGVLPLILDRSKRVPLDRLPVSS
jgi:hypothetical protein